MYRKHACMYFSEVVIQYENASKTDISDPQVKKCHWLINLMFYTLKNGTKMFADHENLGVNFLILKIYWVFMEIWGKYYFPIMAPTKWPPFWPQGEIDVAPYPKTLTMTKGISVPSFMLVPQNACFFHISLGLMYVRRHAPYCDWWLSWQRPYALMIVARLCYIANLKHVLPSVHYNDVNMNICME